MRRRHLLPAGTVFMALVIVLGGLGVAYGLWTDVLEVSGTVTTGTVDAQMTLGEIDEGIATAYDHDGVNDDAEFENKDIAECTAVLTSQVDPAVPGSGSTDQDASKDKVAITVTGAYPSFNCWVEIDVKNIGSIPIKVDPPTVTNTTAIDPAGAVTVETQECWTSAIQLHAGDDSAVTSTTLTTAYPNCRVHIHVEQSAAEGTTYTFAGSFTADQWNEYTAP